MLALPQALPSGRSPLFVVGIIGSDPSQDDAALNLAALLSEADTFRSAADVSAVVAHHDAERGVLYLAVAANAPPPPTGPDVSSSAVQAWLADQSYRHARGLLLLSLSCDVVLVASHRSSLDVPLLKTLRAVFGLKVELQHALGEALANERNDRERNDRDASRAASGADVPAPVLGAVFGPMPRLPGLAAARPATDPALQPAGGGAAAAPASGGGGGGGARRARPALNSASKSGKPPRAEGGGAAPALGGEEDGGVEEARSQLASALDSQLRALLGSSKQLSRLMAGGTGGLFRIPSAVDKAPVAHVLHATADGRIDPSAAESGDAAEPLFGSLLRMLGEQRGGGGANAAADGGGAGGGGGLLGLLGAWPAAPPPPEGSVSTSVMRGAALRFLHELAAAGCPAGAAPTRLDVKAPSGGALRVAGGGKGGGKGGGSRSASEWSARFAVLSEVLFVPGAEPRLSAPGLARLLDADSLFSVTACEAALPRAREAYNRNLPPQYAATEHASRLAAAEAVLREKACGPAYDRYLRSLRAECAALWHDGRRLCDAVSCTGRPCLFRAHPLPLPSSGGGADGGGGAAELLRVGDRVLSVNGTPAAGHAATTAMLKAAVGAIVLEVERAAVHGEAEAEGRVAADGDTGGSGDAAPSRVRVVLRKPTAGAKLGVVLRSAHATSGSPVVERLGPAGGAATDSRAARPHSSGHSATLGCNCGQSAAAHADPFFLAEIEPMFCAPCCDAMPHTPLPFQLLAHAKAEPEASAAAPPAPGASGACMARLTLRGGPSSLGASRRLPQDGLLLAHNQLAAAALGPPPPPPPPPPPVEDFPALPPRPHTPESGGGGGGGGALAAALASVRGGDAPSADSSHTPPPAAGPAPPPASSPAAAACDPASHRGVGGGGGGGGGGEAPRVWVGCEYECRHGHRAVVAPPHRLAEARGAVPLLSQLVGGEAPLARPCLSEGCAAAAQLQRIYVRTPDAPVGVELRPRVRFESGAAADPLAAADPSARTPAESSAAVLESSAPVLLPRGSLVVLRLPFLYYADGSPPLATAATAAEADAAPASFLLPGWLSVVGGEGPAG